MRNVKIKFNIIAIACLLTISMPLVATVPQKELCAADEDSSPFAFSLIPDILIAGTGIGTTAANFIVEKTKDFPEWDGTLYDIQDVNAFDRWAMRPYSKPWHIAGTVSCGLDLAFPVLLYGTEALLGNFP